MLLNTNTKRVIKYEGLRVELYQEELGNQKWVDIAVFEGRIEHRNSHKLLRAALNKFFKWDKDIILGFENLEYINSVGMGILFSIAYSQKEHRKRLLIGGQHPKLNSTFELTGLPPQVLLLESIEAAKKALVESSEN